MGLVERVGRKGRHIVEDLIGSRLADAALQAAVALGTAVRTVRTVDKILLLLGKDLGFFLRHGAADHIGGAHGVACQFPEDLHDLLLIDDHAVGHVQDGFQKWGRVLDMFGVLPVFEVRRDRVHGAGPVKRDHGDDIFKVLRVHVDHQRADAAAFTLEHPEGPAFAEHIVDLCVVHVDIHDIEIRNLFADHVDGVRDDRQRPEPQKVHFQQAEALDPALIILRYDGVAALEQGHVIVHRTVADNNAAGVHARISRHSLDLDGGVDHLFDQRVRVVHFFQVGVGLQRLFDGHAQLLRDLLGHGCRLGDRHAQHLAHVAHRALGGKGTEGSDLRHVVRAVTAHHVVDDLLPALVTEVDIKVGHADAFGIQEPLKQEGVAHGIDIGDAAGIGGDAAGAGASAGPHRDPDGFCIIDIVPYDEEVIDEPHLMDHAQLVIEPVHIRGRIVFAVALYHAFVAQVLEILKMVGVALDFKNGQLGVAELEIHFAAFGNFIRVFKRLGHVREKRSHLVAGFDVKLIGREAHAGILFDGVLGGDTDQDLLDLGVRFRDIMGVVGGDQPDTEFSGKPDDQGVRPLLLVQPVVLDLKEIVVFSEHALIPERGLLRPGIVAFQKCLRDLAGKAGGQADDPLVVLFKQLMVHPGLGIEALHPGGGDDLDQVLVALLVLRKQNKVVPLAVDAVDLVKTGPFGDVDLAADDRVDIMLFARLVKIHRAVHGPVVGHGDRVHAELLDALHKRVDAASAVKQRILGMDM